MSTSDEVFDTVMRATGDFRDKVDPSKLLDDVTEWLGKYMVFPNAHCAPTIALWSAHTYAIGAFYTTPRLVYSSPVPASGKTRGLELVEALANSPIMTTNASVAALFRTIAAADRNGTLPPTLLYDEVDALFGKSATPQSEEARALLNAGYKRGAHVLRCEGDASNMTTTKFPVFAPVALAGLAGNLPDTITTRAIVVELKKRRRNEHVASYRERRARAEIEPARQSLAAWVQSIGEDLGESEPTMPQRVEDRPAEVWEPLLAIADAAGGHWPGTARDACRAFVFAPSRKPPAVGVELLGDIRRVLGERDRIKTADLLDGLRQLEESRWRDEELTARRLAQILAGYSVRSTDIKFSDGTYKGYRLSPTKDQDGLADAFSRYLPPVEGQFGQFGQPASSEGAKSVAHRLPVAHESETQRATATEKATENMALTSTVAQVAEVAPPTEVDGGFPASEPDPFTRSTPDAVAAAILDSLTPDYPLSARTLIGSIPKKLREGLNLDARLAELVDQGTITHTVKGYVLAERNAS